jgi:hypothetical protein
MIVSCRDGPTMAHAALFEKETRIMTDPEQPTPEPADEADAMEEAQKDAAEEREENGGYQ